MKKEFMEKDLLEGGCGRSAEELEFSAAVVAFCWIGFLLLVSGILIFNALC